MLSDIAPVLAIVAMSCIAVYFAFRLVRYGRSGMWPETEARVELYGPYRHLDNAGTRSLSFVDVSYSYTVDGQFYSGQFLSPTLPNDDALTAFLKERLPVGQTVLVRYHSKHPERSIIGQEILAPQDVITELKLE